MLKERGLWATPLSFAAVFHFKWTIECSRKHQCQDTITKRINRLAGNLENLDRNPGWFWWRYSRITKQIQKWGGNICLVKIDAALTFERVQYLCLCHFTVSTILACYSTFEIHTGYISNLDEPSGFVSSNQYLRYSAEAIKSPAIYGSFNGFAGLSCFNIWQSIA